MDLPEYGVFINKDGEAEVLKAEMTTIMGPDGPSAKAVRLTYVATFADVAVADNFCDVWRGEALEDK